VAVNEARQEDATAEVQHVLPGIRVDLVAATSKGNASIADDDTVSDAMLAVQGVDTGVGQ